MRSPDPVFADPRLARVYDAFDGPRDDLVRYCAIVRELAARSVLDLGCGTGTFALLLAADGLAVTAVDPARASLDVARAKPGADAVSWREGDATSLPSLQVDAAVMTGNVAQVFLTDDEWTAVLTAVRAALRPGGALVFETRRLEARAWETWDDVETRDVTGVGRVVQRRQVTDVRLPLVSFRTSYDFGDGTVVDSVSTLCFRELAEVEASLTAAGYEVRDVRDAPDRPGLEYVIIAGEPDG